MSKILEDLYQSIVIPFFDLVPRLIGAILILLIGMAIVRFITNMIRRMLQRIGIDKIKDLLDEVEMVQKSNINFLPSVFLSKFIYYVLVLFIALVATSVLGIPEISELIQDLINLLPSILVAIVILIIGVLLAESIKNIVHTTCKSLGIPAAKVVASFVFFFVLINALMIALKKATIPTDFLTDNLTVILGGIVIAFAIGYGLASKDLMSNYLASIYSKNKFNIGDVITVDNVTGEILDMDTSSLTLLSEGKRLIIPLNRLSSGNIVIHDS